MKIGFIVPTELEAKNIGMMDQHITCAGFGSGKTAACAAAAHLIFHKKCDTIIIWGLAGGLASNVQVNDIVVASSVAHHDYNIAPLMNSTGLGWIQHFAENIYYELDSGLRTALVEVLGNVFPDHRVLEGPVCTGDQFIQHKSSATYNRVEKKALAVDMESAAVVQFCWQLDPKIKVGIVRIISDNANHTASVDFNRFLADFHAMNTRIFAIRKAVEARMNPQENWFLLLQKNKWEFLASKSILTEACYQLFCKFKETHPNVEITHVAGVQSCGFVCGMVLAELFGVPFVPLQKDHDEKNCVLKAGDHVLLADDIVQTGRTLLTARNAFLHTGADCSFGAVFCTVAGANGANELAKSGFNLTFLKEL